MTITFRLFVFILLNTILLPAYSQFNASLGPPTNISNIVKVKNRLFVSSNHLYYSDDNGDNWHVSKNFGEFVSGVHVVDTTLIVSLYTQGVYITNDLGLTWKKSANYTSTTYSSRFKFITLKDSSVLMTNCGEGLYVSNDRGNSWQKKRNGSCIDIATDGKRQYALIEETGGFEAGNLLISTNQFSTYTKSMVYMATHNFRTVAVCDSVLLIGSNENNYIRVFRSIDFGASWVNGNFDLYGDNIAVFREIKVDNNIVYASTAYGIYYSLDKGLNWSLQDYNINYHNKSTLAYRHFGPYTFAIVDNANSIIRKDLDGVWREKARGLASLTNDLYVFRDTLIGRSIDTYYSLDGINWNRYTNQFYNNPEITDQYTSTSIGSILLKGTSKGLYRSEDKGKTWTLNSSHYPYEFHFGKTHIYYNDIWGGLYSSSDSGKSWQSIGPLNSELQTDFLEYDDQTLFSAAPSNLFRSVDAGQTWQSISQIYGTQRLYRVGDLVIRNSSVDGILVSSDKGDTWETYNTGLPVSPKPYVDIFIPYKNMFVAGTRDGIYISTDTCKHWKMIFPRFLKDNFESIYDMEVYKDKMMISSSQGVFYIDLSGLECIGNNDGKGCGKISGVVYFDKNENCSKDNSESYLENRLVKISPGSFIASTDTNGYYEIYLPIGTYEVKSDNMMGIETNTCATSQQSVSLEDLNSATVNISKKYLNLPEVSVSINCGPTRVGFEFHYGIDIQNLGPVNASGKVGIVLDKRINLVSSNIPYTSYINDTIYYDLTDLEFQQVKRIRLVTKIPADINLLGAELTSSAFAIVPSDPETSNNYDSTSRVVTAAIDPNEKLVNPIGEGEEGFIEPSTAPMNYTIHFQNVGTDTAFTVTVIDTLSPRLDISTLRMGAASHNYRLEAKNGNILKWTFPNIKLPDSTTNSKGSNGFLKYYIAQSNTNQPGQVITNNADIYFDYNPPVRTNTTLNTLRLKVTSAVDVKESFVPMSVYPNPTNGRLLIQSATNKKIGSIEIVNSLGSLIYTGYSSESLLEVNMTSWPEGIYFIKSMIGDKLFTFKVCKTY